MSRDYTERCFKANFAYKLPLAGLVFRNCIREGLLDVLEVAMRANLAQKQPNRLSPTIAMPVSRRDSPVQVRPVVREGNEVPDKSLPLLDSL